MTSSAPQPSYPRPPATALPAAQHHVVTEPTQFLGVTQPISLAGPTPGEVELTRMLVATMRENGLFESDEEAQKREMVLGRLNAMTKEFVKQVGMRRGLSEALAVESGGTIFTFGSYRLGVHGTGADIDTLCVVPRHVTREDFFSIMHDMLKNEPDVTELAAVPDAFVPVIKMEFMGIPVRIIFYSLPHRSTSDHTLAKLEASSRVTDGILQLVPDVNEFRIALRCIKLWAKRHGVYSNVMGFLGGVAWAMLVARVCQLYPNATASTLVSKFFNIMFKWQWPQPVLLKPMEDGPLNVRIWNPRIYPADRQHRMPIITPAYPSMCATHNVTQSTHRIMLEQFAAAKDVVNSIVFGKSDWNKLFTAPPSYFFTKYRHYLQVVASTYSRDRHLQWSGMVESKLRQLVLRLEVVEGIELAHPYMKGVDRNFVVTSDNEATGIRSGTWPARGADSDDAVAAAEAAPDQRVLFTTSFYIGLLIKPAPRPANSGPAPKFTIDLRSPGNEFRAYFADWDEHETKITIQNLKRSALPKDVQPTAPLQAAPTTAASKKRPAESLQEAAKRKRTDTPTPATENDTDSMASLPTDTSSAPAMMQIPGLS
ncbi:polynucleotide adenylyltransferase [Allomyces javanicus]|nr:polynucleotide adenylyltransferase [Allomyces javanicus]